MYKGQRKAVLRMGGELPRKKVLDFFSAVSEDLAESARKLGVPRVSGATFEQDVLADSRERPVLLQLYEDTCFLCFLMRPFVNSIAKLLEEQEVPLKIKRLNIERNDFPDYCPVARGTPTFVLFSGEAADKWEEFKPKELVEKLSAVYPQLPERTYAQMDELQGAVSRRFQLFTQLVMWTTELQKLEALVAESAPGAKRPPPPPPPLAEDGKEEEGGFQECLSETMAKDLRRTDCLPENLLHLQKEVDEVEHDAALMGAMLAEAIIRREQAEAQSLQ